MLLSRRVLSRPEQTQDSGRVLLSHILQEMGECLGLHYREGPVIETALRTSSAAPTSRRVYRLRHIRYQYNDSTKPDHME